MLSKSCSHSSYLASICTNTLDECRNPLGVLHPALSVPLTRVYSVKMRRLYCVKRSPGAGARAKRWGRVVRRERGQGENLKDGERGLKGEVGEGCWAVGAELVGGEEGVEDVAGLEGAEGEEGEEGADEGGVGCRG